MRWPGSLPHGMPRATLAWGALIGLVLLSGGAAVIVQIRESLTLEETLKQRMQEVEASRRAIQQANWPDAFERQRWQEADELVKKKILSGLDSPSLLKEVSELAGGLTDVAIAILPPDQFKLLARNSTSPAAEPPAGWGERSYLKLTFLCQYEDLIALFRRLGHANRLIEIESWKVTRNPPKLSVQLILRTTYIPFKEHA